ncbi:hypothetical protein CONPUDRAFT_156242 [Coniophora puteana RWD-64-598 SS2]|uniref:Fork-head domain-containing protein n=1 Tax=Coniophora puteana (strain RWD-64-598) TaxID=741705 RepID=A0A5M3MHY5_CONPW|nr:uncharacterized protein CONPUDRAFT_156242 [Coniophora puteana RWD-64-598 SS2]EIW78241.1 hypothetical protein CONPUDRAFT_156242 [Coniophora puteana RWD-64-598 SS2]
MPKSMPPRSPNRRSRATPYKFLPQEQSPKNDATRSDHQPLGPHCSAVVRVAPVLCHYPTLVCGSDGWKTVPKPFYVYLPLSPQDAFFCEKLGIPPRHSIDLDLVGHLQATRAIPQVSLCHLLGLAIKGSARGRLLLDDLCFEVADHLEKWRDSRYKTLNKISVSNLLGKYNMFYRIPRPADVPGRGNYWALDVSRDGRKDYVPRAARLKANNQKLTNAPRGDGQAADITTLASVSISARRPSNPEDSLETFVGLDPVGDDSQETEVTPSPDPFHPYHPVGLGIGSGSDQAHDNGRELLDVIFSTGGSGFGHASHI